MIKAVSKFFDARRFTRFLLVGGFATALHFIIGLSLVGMSILPPFEANLVAFTCSLFVSYIGQAHYTFGRTITSARQFQRFIFISITTLGLGQLIVMLVTSAGAHYLVALVLIACVNMIISYLLQVKFAFRSDDIADKDMQVTTTSSFTSVYLFFVVIIVIAVAHNLGRQGMWLDEIFSYYFSGQDTDIGGTFERSVTDVHPPFFYILLHFFSHLPVDFERGARGLSLIFGVATLILLFRSDKLALSHRSRAFMISFAAVSGSWTYYSMEARSYALAQLIALLITFNFFSILNREKAGKTVNNANWYYAVILCLIGSFTHYYLFIFSGAGFGMILLCAQTKRSRKNTIMAGLCVLTIVAPFVGWHKAHMLVADADIWFSTDFIFLLNATIGGIRKTLGSVAGAGLVIVFGFYILFRTVSGNFDARALSRSVFPLLLYWLLVAFLAIVVSILFKPVYASRIFVISLPLFWLGLGVTYDQLLRQERNQRSASYIEIGAAVLLFVAATQTIWQVTAKDHEQWRESSLFVESFPSCNASIIPVVDFEVNYTAEPSSQIFYGHYMSGRPNFLPVPRTLLQSGAFPAPLADLWKARIGGEDQCPVLLWSVHHASKANLEEFLRQGVIAVSSSFPNLQKGMVVHEFPKGEDRGGYVVLLDN